MAAETEDTDKSGELDAIREQVERELAARREAAKPKEEQKPAGESAEDRRNRLEEELRREIDAMIGKKDSGQAPAAEKAASSTVDAPVETSTAAEKADAAASAGAGKPKSVTLGEPQLAKSAKRKTVPLGKAKRAKSSLGAAAKRKPASTASADSAKTEVETESEAEAKAEAKTGRDEARNKDAAKSAKPSPPATGAVPKRQRSKTANGSMRAKTGRAGKLDPGTARPKSQADIERKRALQAQQAEIDKAMKKKQMMMYVGITLGTIVLAIIIFAVKDNAPPPAQPKTVVETVVVTTPKPSSKPPSAAGSLALRRTTKDANALVQNKDFAGAIALYEEFKEKRPDEAESAQAKIDYIVNTFLGGVAPGVGSNEAPTSPDDAPASEWDEVAGKAAALHKTGDPEKFLEAIHLLAAYRDTHALDRAKADGLIAKLGRFYFEKTGKFPVVPEPGSTQEKPPRERPPAELDLPPADPLPPAEVDLPPADDAPPPPSEFDLPPLDDAPPPLDDAPPPADDAPPALDLDLPPGDAFEDLPPAPDEPPAAAPAEGEELDFDLPGDFGAPPPPAAE
jgi:hypothetical protein